MMEAAPPSYEKATLTNYWDIVANYMPSTDLCAAALVSRSWHATFVPHLWGNPASHFGIGNDAVYVALTRFKRTLKTARVFVRALTHTLHLPPAHAELYDGPHAEWLRDILERLPSLQTLIVRGLPFFDHAALQALHFVRRDQDARSPVAAGIAELPGSIARLPSSTLPSFGLRLLDASRCSNVTSHGLVQALGRFESLMYLDLSFTYPARDTIVLESIRRFLGLQVLKLRGLGLKDKAIDTLSRAMEFRVRSLDIRDNNVSDGGIRTLLEHSIASKQHGTADSGQRSPSLIPYLGSEMLDIYQGQDFEGYLRNAFTNSFVARLAIEDAPDGGITHLYIAGNDVTVEGVSGLIRSQRLHVLDIGAVKGVMHSLPSHMKDKAQLDVEIPGVEKLTPVFAKHATESLTFLRIDHSLVTKDVPASLKNEIVPGRAELDDTCLPYTSTIAELGGKSVRPDAVEMPAVSQDSVHEAFSDAAQIRASFTSGSNNAQIHRPFEVRRGSIYAPEVVLSPSTEPDDAAGMRALPARECNTVPAGMRELVTFPSTPGNSQLSPHQPLSSYLSIARERQARLNAHVLSSHSLHPAMLPHVTTLVLTDVPAFSADMDIANRIILFIKACAEEASLAHGQARLDYALPPGRSNQATAVKQSARRIFALNCLVLELASDAQIRQSGPSTPWQQQESRSMTGDRDSEALWAASETDFSFFGDEECGLPSLEPSGPSFFASSTRKEVGLVDPFINASAMTRPNISDQPKFETATLIAAFRNERRLAHQRSIAMRNSDAQTEGFWPGVVQVVKSSGRSRSDKETDYHGNKFTNKYYYQ